MVKPPEFEQACTAVQNVPYTYNDESHKNTLSGGGVLGKGRVVWTRKVYDATERPHAVTAFVDDLGVISLDPRWLVRAAV